MLVRRSRAHVKPNVARGSKLGRISVEKKNSPSSHDSQSANVNPDIESADHLGHLAIIGTAAEDIRNVEDSSYGVCDNSLVSHDDDQVYEHADPLTPTKRTMHVPVDSKLLPPKSPNQTFSSEYIEINLPRPRKKFSSDEKLDPKKMRMMDMIYWNPKKEKTMSRRHVETESIVSEGKQPVSEEINDVTNKSVAPQVKIGPDGRLIIDEKSLAVAESNAIESVWETIDEDRTSRKVTSLSFRNRLWRKGTVWTEKETELFYEILRCTGPDFGLMHEFFPSRARNELKSKFNREERTNWQKLKEVMSKPALLDDDLYERAASIQKEIEEEALVKKMKKDKDGNVVVTRKKKNRNCADSGELEWSERTADLVAEASEIINEMELEWTARNDDQTNRVHFDSSNNHLEDSSDMNNVEEHFTKTRKSERTKLSKKAQELLNQTVNCLEPTVVQRIELQSETNTTAPEESFDGYGGWSEDCDDGSYEDVDASSIANIPCSSKMLVRERHAARITQTTNRINRQNLETEQGTSSFLQKSTAKRNKGRTDRKKKINTYVKKLRMVNPAEKASSSTSVGVGLAAADETRVRENSTHSVVSSTKRNRRPIRASKQLKKGILKRSCRISRSKAKPSLPSHR